MSLSGLPRSGFDQGSLDITPPGQVTDDNLEVGVTQTAHDGLGVCFVFVWARFFLNLWREFLK